MLSHSATFAHVLHFLQKVIFRTSRCNIVKDEKNLLYTVSRVASTSFLVSRAGDQKLVDASDRSG